MQAEPATDPCARFSPATRAWFASAFAAPTPAQAGAWDAIASGRHVLVVAPTGSGKTLAAFLWAVDRLAAEPPPGPGVRILYVSPLKALAVDVERNLRTPLAGIRGAAVRLGLPPPAVAVGVRSGDTAADARRRFAREPPDVLITTPESLFLLLTSAAREALRTVSTVIVDEVHAVAGTKRGSHLALSLERLDALLPRPAQRIGLSATVCPLDEVARFLGGVQPVAVVEAPAGKRLQLEVVVPVEDLAAPPSPAEDAADPDVSAPGVPARSGVWPHVEQRVLDLVRAHGSTIVFANSRRLAERLCARLNELAGADVARAHHGSVSREQREAIEEALRAGSLPAVVATSSLELGIDMGAVDLVVQVEAPDSVATGLQRVGRAGHRVGATSRGVFFPRYRGDLLECAVVVERMRARAIEALRAPRNPLDVLAQQVVAMVAMDDWTVDGLETAVRRALPFAELPRTALEAVLDMLAGRYPSDLFAELRPRIVWDRTTNRLTPRPQAQRLAVTSGGTIPDRGLYGVFLAGDRPTRVGELDEEMVYESRVGEVFLLGASSWRIAEITHDRVLVTPAPGEPGKMPFWHGDAPGRPLELGRAIGAWVRELAAHPDPAGRLRDAGLDALAADNLLRYLAEQREATGAIPDDRTLVVERFRDAVGDWRVCIHSWFGARVHAPWARAIEARLHQRLGIAVQSMYTDDGIVVRIPEGSAAPPTDGFWLDPEEVDELVTAEVGDSALFASRFRECAARALLLPRRRPGQRTPLWLQRQKSAALLQAARRFPAFPIVLETYRECLQDVFDLPALAEVLSAVRARAVHVVEVETALPSPFAAGLQLGYVGAFMYEGDAPLAERRAQALSLDRTLLHALMGRAELRELLDADALGTLELELQLLADDRRVRDADGLHDALRLLGDVSEAEAAARAAPPDAAAGWLAALERAHRALRVRIHGAERWIAAEDAGRVRDALGVALPVGVPHAFLEAVADPLGDLVARFARRHGPFHAADVAARFGLGVAVVEAALRALEVDGRVVEGEFRPGGSGGEWIDAEVLRRLRRRSLAALRREVEAVSPDAFARFTAAWHGIAGGALGRRPTADALLRVVEQLQGVPIPASALESLVLPARLPAYAPVLLDQLGAAGEVVWAGAGPLGPQDGWVVLALAEHAAELLPDPSDVEPSPLARRVLKALAGGGALFFRQIAAAVRAEDDAELVAALWDLVWSGHVTNDTLGPLRALLARRGRVRHDGRGRRPAKPTRLGPPAGAGRWSLVAGRERDGTRRLHAQARQLLLRHGVATRGAIGVERVPGGFAALYPVLKAFEEAGRCRRGYFVEGLGGAQFAHPGAVDRMRGLVEPASAPRALVLAATDPANPYGAALSWPERADDGGHRPGRKAGAVVVLVEGRLVLYVEKGGRTLLSYADDEVAVEAAAEALASAARVGVLGRVQLRRADGEAVLDTPVARALAQAGFHPTPWGMRVRA